jgi:hypothetical protein
MTDKTSSYRMQTFGALPLKMKKVATKTAAQAVE